MATSKQKTVAPSSDLPDSAEVRHQKQLATADLLRQRQGLTLQRENILSQRTSNPARRAALEAALTQVEAQLAALD